MRPALTVGLLLLLISAPLAAQRGVGGRSGRPGISSAPPDARIGAGRARTSNRNILYPGSPSGGRPGSILTPGTPRSPGASALPATPGAAVQTKPRPGRGRGHRQRVFGGRGGYVPVYGYGYGGVYIDSGYGPVEVPEEERAESERAYVMTAPSREPKEPPTPRVYDVREDADGRVEMTSIAAGDGRETLQNSVDYWLIALKGGLIYAADQYWRQQETFRFTTLEGKEFVVSMAELDVDFTERLNADLGRRFRKP